MKRIRVFLSMIAFAFAVAGAFASSSEKLVDYGYKVGGVCHITSVDCPGGLALCSLDVPEDETTSPVPIFERNDSQCGKQARMN